MTDLTLYDYDLPPELIAQHPLAQRDAARLLVVNRATQQLWHQYVSDLPSSLQPGDALVVNQTRVVPARLIGRRAKTGGQWEGLFLDALPDGCWRIMCRTRGKLQPGEIIQVEAPPKGTDAETRLAEPEHAEPEHAGKEHAGKVHAGKEHAGKDRAAAEHAGASQALGELRLEELLEGGLWRVRPLEQAQAEAILNRMGRIPLPLYIRQGRAEQSDRQSYQTIFASAPGAVAAPTAGLHFTEPLLERLQGRGVVLVRVTLHVGLGTFRPISADRLDEHQMHAEWGQLDAEAVQALNGVRNQGGRIVAVGTTSMRVLETAVGQDRQFRPWEGWTDLFIRPPFRFRAVDALMTNFHLPRSTLLVLVQTFGGSELIRQAYHEAIAQRYRFYSYGDAMLIE